MMDAWMIILGMTIGVIYTVTIFYIASRLCRYMEGEHEEKNTET